MPCALRDGHHIHQGIGQLLLSAAQGLLQGVYLIIRKGTKIFGVRDASEQCRRCVGVVSEF